MVASTQPMTTPAKAPTRGHRSWARSLSAQRQEGDSAAPPPEFRGKFTRGRAAGPASGDSNAHTGDSRSFSRRMVGAFPPRGGRRGAIQAELAGLVARRWKPRAMLRAGRLWCARVSSPPRYGARVTRLTLGHLLVRCPMGWCPPGKVHSGDAPARRLSLSSVGISGNPRDMAEAIAPMTYKAPVPGASSPLPERDTRALRFHDHDIAGREGRPRRQGCPASRPQPPQPRGGRGHLRRWDRFVLDFSQCPTAAPPQHPKTPGLSREPLSGQ